MLRAFDLVLSFKFRLLFLHRGNFPRPILPRYQEQMSLFEDYPIDEAAAPSLVSSQTNRLTSS